MTNFTLNGKRAHTHARGGVAAGHWTRHWSGLVGIDFISSITYGARAHVSEIEFIAGEIYVITECAHSILVKCEKSAHQYQQHHHHQWPSHADEIYTIAN